MNLLLPMLLLWTTCMIPCASRAQTLQSSFDLGTHGWQSTSQRHAGIEEYEGTYSQHMAFDSHGVLYASFAIQGATNLALPGQGNNIYRILAIDPMEDAVIRILDFPTQSKHRVALNISATDQLLISANDEIKLVDRDGFIRNNRKFPLTKRLTRAWQIAQSPSGKILMASEDSQTSFTFLSTSDLSVVAQCAPLPDTERPFTYTDTFEVNPGGGSPFRSLYSGPLCGRTERIENLGSIPVTPILLADGQLLEFRRDSLILRRKDGHVAWSIMLPDHHVLYPLENKISLARNSSRFAVLALETKGGNASFDITPKIMSMAIEIYDVQTGTIAKTVPLKKGRCDEFVLSQDGGKLAIQYDSTVEVWNLH
jgi:hypothetical protein